MMKLLFQDGGTRRCSLLLCILWIRMAVCFCPADVVITTSSGKLRGVCESRLNRSLTAFYGVPYAKPPVGQLRFVPPQPLLPWEGVYNATSFSHWCPQELTFLNSLSGLHDLSSLALDQIRTSEDCLYLNIYIPGDVRLDRMDPLPIMVWIHGGGFNIGSASYIDAGLLATQTNIIIVTINYRLGVFGFLTMQDTLARGNYGLQDQTLALQWLKNNARWLSSDPSLVTIAGQSSGAKSTILHMLSPQSAGLFSRAIVQSGTTLSLERATQHNDKFLALAFAREAGCSSFTNSSNVLQCLRQLTTNQTLRHVKTLSQKMNTTSPFLPTVDGIWMPALPTELAGKGLFSKVDLLIGTTSMEGSVLSDTHRRLFEGHVEETLFKSAIEKVVVMLGFPDWLRETVNSLVVAQYYPGILTNHTTPSSNDFKVAIMNIVSDSYLGLTRRYADQHAISVLGAGKGTYQYLFRHRPTFTRRGGGPWDAAHGDDLFFLFGDVLNRSSIPVSTSVEKQLSYRMMAAWASFIKTGTPDFGRDLGLVWSPYSKDSPFYVEITPNLGAQSRKLAMAEAARLFWSEALIDNVMSGRQNFSFPDNYTIENNVINDVTIIPTTTEYSEQYRSLFHMTAEQADITMLALFIILALLLILFTIVLIACCWERRRMRRQRRNYESSTKF